MKTWSDVNALYQIYPRSFMDANGDGIGDLKGIISKLDYLKGGKDSLGVDAVWISPFYPSPMTDFGYDVTDHCAIDPIFGDMEDFKALVSGMHERDIKIMLDFVLNHTSDQHPWFVDALTGKHSDKRDYYVWRDPKPGGGPPNNWVSNFNGSSWKFDEVSGQYYLHTFLESQPDLNWDNPAVRQEMQMILRHWLDLGVDGFRFDAIWPISKDLDFRDNPINPDYEGDPSDLWYYIRKYNTCGPHMFDYLREMTDVVASYPDKRVVFEYYPDHERGSLAEQYREFYDINPEIGAPFNFGGFYASWGADSFREFVTEFQGMLRPQDVPMYCFGNHDQMRLATRFGWSQARLIAMLQLMLPGLPTVYYGDEIGMQNGEIPPSRILDPPGRNPTGGRDPERTPMQWSGASLAGFSKHEPWLPVAKSFRGYNVADETDDAGSYLSLYRILLHLRSTDLTLVHGSYATIDSHPDVFAFERKSKDSTYIVALNFSDSIRRVFMSYSGEIICGTYPDDLPTRAPSGEVDLRPFEGIVVKL